MGVKTNEIYFYFRLMLVPFFSLSTRTMMSVTPSLSTPPRMLPRPMTVSTKLPRRRSECRERQGTLKPSSSPGPVGQARLMPVWCCSDSCLTLLGVDQRLMPSNMWQQPSQCSDLLDAPRLPQTKSPAEL